MRGIDCDEAQGNLGDDGSVLSLDGGGGTWVYKLVRFHQNVYLRGYISVWTYLKKVDLKKQSSGTSLVVQWLRTRLPMQGTRVRSLVREDPTCRGTTKPVCHNY